MKCLLCNSNNVSELEKIPTKRVVDLYYQAYKSNFSYLFTEPYISLMECADCDLRFYSPSITGDNNFYSVLQKKSWYYREEKYEYKFASSFINKGEKVLDIGCGTGAFSNMIEMADFTGLEFSQDAIHKGESLGRKIIAESIEEHSLHNSNTYDVVTAFQVLEHISGINQFIKSSANCVKPGGLLIVAVPSDESYIKFKSNAILNMPPRHISRWTDKALYSIAKIIDFNVVEIHHEKLDPDHREDYLTTLIERSLLRNLEKPAPLVEDGIIYRVRRKVTDILTPIILKNGIDPAWSVTGQCVIAVYKK